MCPSCWFIYIPETECRSLSRHMVWQGHNACVSSNWINDPTGVVVRDGTFFPCHCWYNVWRLMQTFACTGSFHLYIYFFFFFALYTSISCWSFLRLDDSMDLGWDCTVGLHVRCIRHLILSVGFSEFYWVLSEPLNLLSFCWEAYIADFTQFITSGQYMDLCFWFCCPKFCVILGGWM